MHLYYGENLRVKNLRPTSLKTSSNSSVEQLRGSGAGTTGGKKKRRRRRRTKERHNLSDAVDYNL